MKTLRKSLRLCSCSYLWLIDIGINQKNKTADTSAGIKLNLMGAWASLRDMVREFSHSGEAQSHEDKRKQLRHQFRHLSRVLPGCFLGEVLLV